MVCDPVGSRDDGWVRLVRSAAHRARAVVDGRAPGDDPRHRPPRRWAVGTTDGVGRGRAGQAAGVEDAAGRSPSREAGRKDRALHVGTMASRFGIRDGCRWRRADERLGSGSRCYARCALFTGLRGTLRAVVMAFISTSRGSSDWFGVDPQASGSRPPVSNQAHENDGGRSTSSHSRSVTVAHPDPRFSRNSAGYRARLGRRSNFPLSQPRAPC